MTFGIRRYTDGAREIVLLEHEGALYDAAGAIGEPVTMADVVSRPDVIDRFEAALAGGLSPVTTAGWRILPPTVDRPAVFCAGANYSDHVAEMGEKPLTRAYHFVSPPTVLAGDGDEVRRPAQTELLDWEVELVAVIGRPTFGATVENALDSVVGYAVGNDVSVRGTDFIHPIFGMDWGVMKNPDGLTPVGPALIPARFVADPQRLAMTLSVDGVVRQDSSTAYMSVTVAEQIAAISLRTTLLPGDLILTGTPAGTARSHADAYLTDGATMVASIEGLGTLTNTVAPTMATNSEGQS